MKWCVLILVLLLTACPSADRPPPAPAPGIEWADPEALALAPAQRSAVLAAYAHHRADWTHYMGRAAPTPVLVRFHGAARLVNDLEGLTSWPSMIVDLVVGANLEAPYTFHELCHLDRFLQTGDGDSQHKDSHWIAWNVEQQASIASLTSAS